MLLKLLLFHVAECFTNSGLDCVFIYLFIYLQGGSNMTGTDLYVNKPNCAAAVRP